ncbi:MAG: hypothetical protein ACRD8A_13915 [Candidatus Acidiferrales bacterium]
MGGDDVESALDSLGKYESEPSSIADRGWSGRCKQHAAGAVHAAEEHREDSDDSVLRYRPAGCSVRGIVASELSIHEDKGPPNAVVALHEPTQLPLRLAVVIQASGSMKDNALLQPALAALPVFLRSVMIGKSDRAFFETFGKTVHSTNWMDVVAASGVAIKLYPRSLSALYDAIESACTEMDADSAWPARRAILLLRMVTTTGVIPGRTR